MRKDGKPGKQSADSKVKLSAVNPLPRPARSAEAERGPEHRLLWRIPAHDSYE